MTAKEHLKGLEFTLENIRKFVERYPNNGATAPWQNMLEDDPEGTEYTLDDYQEEIEEQVATGDIPPRSAARVCEVFPGTFYFDDEESE